MATPHATTWPVHATRAERRAQGKAARAVLSLDDLAVLAETERDPVALVGATDEARVPWLVPIRYGRMLRSAFTFYRGSAVLMAFDLAQSPNSGLEVQLCGDAHLANFGMYGSPERSLVFDLNDFDETLPGPFEWDVKRLIASLAVCARDRGFKPKRQRAIALAAAAEYRRAMRVFADLSVLQTWYAQLDVDKAISETEDLELRDRAERLADRARGKDNLQAAARFTEVVDGRRRIVADPPRIVRIEDLPTREPGDVEELVRATFLEYRDSVRDDVRVLLDRYTFVDAAIKVVGVGSVGTRCFIVLMQGCDEQDLLFLQVKEAGPSVLEAHLGHGRYHHHGHRVVAGQRLMQSASDTLLGWATGPAGRQYYWRQLRDWKGSADFERMDEKLLLKYGEICAWTLAKAHARSGDRVAIAAYLGSSTAFEEAMTTFATTYADRAEQDYALLQAAVAAGRVVAHDDAESAA